MLVKRELLCSFGRFFVEKKRFRLCFFFSLDFIDEIFRSCLYTKTRYGIVIKKLLQEGDYVQFVRDETCAREGRVRRVLLTPRPGIRPAEGQRAWYLDADNILYIVTARGHDHRIRAADILGRFVSSERVSRIVPLQD